MKGSLAPLWLSVALSGCATAPPHDASLADLRGSWQLDADRVPTGARIPTVSVGADGVLSGTSGVNRYRGMLDLAALSKGRWQAGGFNGTRMAGTAEAMGLEADFLRALATADRAIVQGDQLSLQSGGTVMLVLRRVSTR